MNLSFQTNFSFFALSVSFHLFNLSLFLSLVTLQRTRLRTTTMTLMMTKRAARNLGRIGITFASSTPRRFSCKMSTENSWATTAVAVTMRLAGAKKATQSFSTSYTSRAMPASPFTRQFHLSGRVWCSRARSKIREIQSQHASTGCVAMIPLRTS